MPHTCTPSDSYANSWPLAFINCYYIQTHRQHFLIDTHTHTHISNYNLLPLYNVTCMYALRPDNLVLDNELVPLPEEDHLSCSQH